MSIRYPSRRHTLAALALVGAAVALPIHADDDDRARAARAAGNVLPLDRILAGIERELPGRLIEVELEREDGALRYELELLLPDGRVIELEVDARTGAWLKLKGARLETALARSRGTAR